MKRYCLVICLFLIAGGGLPAGAAQTAEEMLKAVVKIQAKVPKEAFTAGTLGTEREGHGVIIDDKGHVLTIGYLIVEAESLQVTGPEGEPMKATFVGYDQTTGFGLLRLAKPPGIKPMTLGESSRVKEGDPLLVAGYGGSDSVIAAAVISRREFAAYWEYLLDEPLFTAPAYLNFGGAALINPDGQLVGIGSLLTQVSIPGLGAVACNLFVPIDLLKPILDDLITRGRPQHPPRPWLGINAEESHGRVFITQVTPGGPAERAGLKTRDLIVSLNGKEVLGLADFYRRLWALGKAGVEVPLRILRGTEIGDFKVLSGDRYRFLLLTPKRI